MTNHPYLESARKLAALLVYARDKFQVTSPSGYDSFYSWLEERGVYRLGNGAFSVVFEHASAPGLVVKLGLKPQEDSGVTYLAYARANPGPLIPKVYHLERGTNHYLAVLDKLREASSSEFLRYDQYACPVLRRIKKFFRGVATIDMHSENVMVDKDGVLVITDPVSYIASRDLCTGIERAYGLEDPTVSDDE